MAFAPITPQECAAKITAAASIVVLSGAGMSTSAGVPDFRGPKGIYVTRAYDPEATFDIGYFRRDPKPFYAFSRDFLTTLDRIEPTYTHTFLAELERKGKDVRIITQNIDGLHQRAGSTKVYPMHGDYQTAHCCGCGRSYSFEELRRMMQTAEVPLCTACSAVIKPDVVFFGENVRHMEESVAMASKADLFFVLGSSLTVYPASMLPEYAECDIVIVNKGDVGARPAQHRYHADTGLDEFFTEVAACL